MQARMWSSLLLCGLLSIAVESWAQTPVGALAVGERRSDQWGRAVDYETAAAAREAALLECGAGCSVVLTFDRCGAYATDQDAGSTAMGWAEAYASADAARQTALAECRSRGGGSGCTVRAWGCNGPVVEEGLNLDRTARRQIQQGLAAGSFDPGAADGLFGPRTRAAIRRWQSSRGARPTGYLNRASAEALQTADRSGPAVADSAAAAVATQAPPPPASAELEGLFWQSIMNSTNPAEFEAYLAQFPNGVFRALALARLEALRAPAIDPPAAGMGAARTLTGGSQGSSSPVSGAGAPALAAAASGDAPRRPGDVFQDCDVCPEMVVLPGGNLAMGRYEVTVGEYRAFASATGGTGGDCANIGVRRSWRDPGFPQTDRHPVTCMSWNDAQAYVSWLSRTTGMTYRLPTEAEWERAAAGSQPGCFGLSVWGTCPVGSHGANAAGLSDMAGNLEEWTQDCWEGDCGRRVLRGGSWATEAPHPGMRDGASAADARAFFLGLRVSRTLD